MHGLHRPRSSRAGFTLIEMMVVIAVIALLILVSFPHFWQARTRAHYSACRQNLKNIAVGLQAYGNDHNLSYPSTLSAVTPIYLAEIPSCPAASGLINTYELGYEKSDLPATFTVTCQGAFHVPVPDVLPNQPYYIDGQGVGP